MGTRSKDADAWQWGNGAMGLGRFGQLVSVWDSTSLVALEQRKNGFGFGPFGPLCANYS